MEKSKSTEKVEINRELDIGETREVNVNGKSFYLEKTEKEGYVLFSRTCPHMGGKVEQMQEKYKCPLHGWEFKKSSGKCTNVEGKSLKSYSVREKESKLVAEVPVEEDHAKPSNGKKKDVEIELHAHACLEVTCGDFSLLTDPWLKGNAFMGAWELFPPPVTEPNDIDPDAIWISHEHSDHFHIETLKEFPKDKPIYFPDFPNQRIEKILRNEGFENLKPMPFGEPFGVGEDFKITCFEPKSMWNDSIVLVECGNQKILNLNDAGLNDNVADVVGEVDIVSSAHTWGASGYPLTWTHLDDEEKENVIEESNKGMLDMLQQAADLYGADYVLPFAAHWVLWHPDHRDYLEKMEKNRLKDVVDAFDERDVEVIDLYPGESWRSETEEFQRLWSNRERLRNSNYIQNFAENRYDDEKFSKYHPGQKSIEKEIVEEYFLRLNKVPDIKFCSDITVRLKYEGEKSNEDNELIFKIEDGRLETIEQTECYDLFIKLPENVLASIIEEDLSWDEAHIGYWCEMYRSPDEYHFDFWRLLQAPYYQKSPNIGGSGNGELSTERSISDVLEEYGSTADRILRRYGLYCVGCQHSPQETIRDGARAHGLSEEKTQRLVEELNQVLHGR